MNPFFWLVLSFLLVSISLTAVLMVLVPTITELSRAARSIEKLCDTLNRELPPTLESIRLTSLELTELTDDLTEGVHNAGRVARQVDKSVTHVRQQAQQVQVSSRSLAAGVRAAWKTLTRSSGRDRRRLAPGPSHPVQHLPAQSESQLPSGSSHQEFSAPPSSMSMHASPPSFRAESAPAQPADGMHWPGAPPSAANVQTTASSDQR